MSVFRIRCRIRIPTLFGVMAAALASMTALLNQRQDITVYPAAALLGLAAVSVWALSPRVRFNRLSSGTILFALFLVASVSNITYLTGEVETPFRSWVRLLFPIVLLQFSTVLMLRSPTCLHVFTAFFIFVILLASYKVHTISDVLIELEANTLQTNWGNAVAAASPFVFLVRNRIIRNALLIFVIFTLVDSLKRSASLAASILVLSAVLAEALTVNGRPLQTLQTAGKALLFSGIYLTAIIIASRNEDTAASFNLSLRRLENSMEDGGSGRLSVWADSMRIMDDAGLWRHFFGHGFTWFHDNRHRYGFAAESLHNDLVEFWISFGLIGVVLYLVFVGRLIFLAVFVSRNLPGRIAFSVSTILIFLVYSQLAGTFFYYFFFVPLFVGIGYLEALGATATENPEQNTD